MRRSWDFLDGHRPITPLFGLWTGSGQTHGLVFLLLITFMPWGLFLETGNFLKIKLTETGGKGEEKREEEKTKTEHLEKDIFMSTRSVSLPETYLTSSFVHMTQKEESQRKSEKQSDQPGMAAWCDLIQDNQTNVRSNTTVSDLEVQKRACLGTHADTETHLTCTHLTSPTHHHTMRPCRHSRLQIMAPQHSQSEFSVHLSEISP